MPPEPEPPQTERVLWGRPGLALFLAWGAFLITLSPSLLPRPWYLQAPASAISALLAYLAGAIVQAAIAVVLGWAGLRAQLHLVSPVRARWCIAITVTVLTAAAWIAGHEGRANTASLVGTSPPSWGDDLLAFAGALVAAAIMIQLVWLTRWVLRVARRFLDRFMPAPLAAFLVVVLFIGGTGWVMESVVAARALDAISAGAALRNDEVPQGVRAPSSRLVSGGPGSTQSWSQLGYQGRIFTGLTPSAADISAVTHEPASDPIRVYTAPTGGTTDPAELASITVRELRRTGAFDRPKLLLLGTTGSGWVDEYNVASFEFLTGGDCASAAVQYSFLPSHIAFVTNRGLPEQVGKAVFAAVRKAIDERPADKRPQLYVSGESLGSYGMQAAFPDQQAMLRQVDGAVWIGTPNSTPLWRSITASRQRGSPQIAPVIDNGAHVRFATRPSDLTADRFGRPLGSWSSPRIVYLQHASDPIVWWDPSLIWKNPDWTGERAGSDVDTSFEWWPLVTFWMMTVDLAVANTTPPGHGHIYHEDIIDSWAGVLGVPLAGSARSAIAAAIDERRARN